MTTNVPFDYKELARLKRLADESHHNYEIADQTRQIAKMKMDDAFDAYHRYLKQQK